VPATARSESSEDARVFSVGRDKSANTAAVVEVDAPAMDGDAWPDRKPVYSSRMSTDELMAMLEPTAPPEKKFITRCSGVM